MASRLADTGQRLGGGQAVVQLLENDSIRVRLGVPTTLADALTVGDTVTVESGANAYTADVFQISPNVDPATRTRDVVLRLQDGARVAYGAVVDVVIAQQVEQSGTWVPLSALGSGPNGSWRVFVPPQAGEVAPVGVEAVEVLHTRDTEAFVRGALPEGGEVVASGLHRLVPGQIVVLGAGAE
ncbi:MAG: HlyD family efflux transporter periplasmic adaptor subunit [Rhodobacteraceae bacterium]|nr:HlyD family efflux transporter periplasmic adaptor subunit [Paracoccaceae bacterium]